MSEYGGLFSGATFVNKKHLADFINKGIEEGCDKGFTPKFGWMPGSLIYWHGTTLDVEKLVGDVRPNVLIVSQDLQRGISNNGQVHVERPGAQLYGARYDTIIVLCNVDKEWATRMLECRLAAGGSIVWIGQAL